MPAPPRPVPGPDARRAHLQAVTRCISTIGSVSRSYIRNCAIHHTFNRAVTVRQAPRAERQRRLRDAGSYFIEDGIESQNRIEGNLAVSTRPSSSLLDTDTTPALDHQPLQHVRE